MMLRSALWVFAGKLGNQAVSLVVVMILARLLTPEDFGIVAAAQVILTLSQVVVRFGIGAYLIQVEELSSRLVSTAQTLMLSAALVISAILLAVAKPIGMFINVPELPQIMPLLLASFILSAAINPAASVLSRDMEFKFIAQTEVVSQVLGYGFVAILLSYCGLGYWAILIGTVFQNFIRCVQIFCRMPVWPTLALYIDDIIPMLRFGGGVFFAQMMTNIAQRADNLVVSSTAGASALGFYSRAYSIMEMSNTLIGSVARETLFSGFSKKRREGELDDSDHAFLMAHTFATFLIIPVMMLTWLLSQEIVWILLGENWVDTIPVLEVLALGMFFRLAYKVSGSFILSQGAVYYLFFRNLIYASLVVILALVGSSQGIVGVAWGVFVALALHFFLINSSALNNCGSTWFKYLKSIFPFFLSGSVATVVAYQVRESLTGVSLVAPLGTGVAFLGMYSAILFGLRYQGAVSQVLNRLLELAQVVQARAPER